MCSLRFSSGIHCGETVLAEMGIPESGNCTEAGFPVIRAQSGRNRALIGKLSVSKKEFSITHGYVLSSRYDCRYTFGQIIEGGVAPQ